MVPELNKQWIILIVIAAGFTVFFFLFSLYESLVGSGDEFNENIVGFEETTLFSDSTIRHFGGIVMDQSESEGDDTVEN